MWWEHSWDWSDWLVMSLLVLVFWVSLVTLLVGVARGWLGGSRRADTTDVSGAEQVLADRFARGELDEQEYRHRLDVLRGAAFGPLADSRR